MSEENWSPNIWLEFDKQGTIDESVVHSLGELLSGPGVEELVILSHGWNNDKADATKLYSDLWTNTAANFPKGMTDRMVVAGVLWPSKAYRTDFDVETLTRRGAGQTLSVSGGAVEQDLSEEQFESLLVDFEKFLGEAGVATVNAARKAADSLTGSSAHALVKEAAAAIGIGTGLADSELKLDSTMLIQAQASETDAHQLFLNLADPPQLELPERAGTVLGLGSLVQGVISGVRAAIARFLNYLTFYEMKNRSGIIGVSLTDKLLAKLAPPRPIRLHFVGHSFGGRLVTAAANRFASVQNLELFSLTILQGAYSHNALARQIKPGLDGAFPSVVGKPTGPISITHTHNDLALTIAYPLASRLSHDITQAIGDANDEFGAMGANGPQKLPAGVAEPDNNTQEFDPKRAKVNTFLADGYIVATNESDAHNNVTNPTVGLLLAKTIMA